MSVHGILKDIIVERRGQQNGSCLSEVDTLSHGSFCDLLFIESVLKISSIRLRTKSRGVKQQSVRAFSGHLSTFLGYKNVKNVRLKLLTICD